MTFLLGGPTMRPREMMPLSVWLTLALIVFGTAAYVATYFMVEDFVKFLK
jgi:hypothetical protein